MRLLDAVEKARRPDLKCACQLDDRGEPGIAPRKLQSADLGRVEFAEEAERFLGQIEPQPLAAKVLTEDPGVIVHGHAGMIREYGQRLKGQNLKSWTSYWYDATRTPWRAGCRPVLSLIPTGRLHRAASLLPFRLMESASLATTHRRAADRAESSRRVRRHPLDWINSSEAHEAVFFLGSLLAIDFGFVELILRVIAPV